MKACKLMAAMITLNGLSKINLILLKAMIKITRYGLKNRS